MIEKSKKHCPQCKTKYSIQWDIEQTDIEPLTCPFCGYEVDMEDYDEEKDFENIESQSAYEIAEDDSWN